MMEDIHLLPLSRSLASTYGILKAIGPGVILRGQGGSNIVCSRCETVIGAQMGGFPSFMNAAAACHQCGVVSHLTKSARYKSRVPMLADLVDTDPPPIALKLATQYKSTSYAEPIRHLSDSLSAIFIQKQIGIPRILFHYTGVDAVFSILNSGSIWATDIAYMNDSSELSYANSLIHSVSEEFAEVNENLTELLGRGGASRADPDASASGYFVSSFCVDGDLLSQWRAYGDGGKGIAIGFNAFQFSSPNVLVRKVLYNVVEQQELVRNTLKEFASTAELILNGRRWEDLEDVNTLPALSALLASYLTEYSFSFKHPSFAEENEWRIIIPYTRDEWISRISFRANGPFLIPYTAVRFGDGDFSPHLPLLEIVHGPSPNPALIKKSLHLLLERCGYEHVEVRGSTTPLRV